MFHSGLRRRLWDLLITDHHRRHFVSTFIITRRRVVHSSCLNIHSYMFFNMWTSYNLRTSIYYLHCIFYYSLSLYCSIAFWQFTVNEYVMLCYSTMPPSSHGAVVAQQMPEACNAIVKWQSLLPGLVLCRRMGLKTATSERTLLNTKLRIK